MIWQDAVIAPPLSGNSRAVLFCLWCLITTAVIIGSLLPADSLPMSDFDLLMLDLNISDKVQHFGAYLILAFLLVWSVNRIQRIAAILPALVLQGLALELGQAFVPGRVPDIMDFLANALGVFTGAILGLWVRSLRVRRYHVPLP